MLKTVKHPRFAPYWKSIIEADLAADTKFLREELRLNNHGADFLKARIILERTSFVYVLTEDSKQLEVAKLAINLTRDMGLRFCGVDIMVTGDIAGPPKKYCIIEINSAPGLDHYVLSGKKQEKIVEDMYLQILKAME